MTSAARRKGIAGEREFARTVGGRRTPLSGAVGGGDAEMPSEGVWADWMWEVKRRAKLPAIATQALHQAEAAIPIGSPKRPAAVYRQDRGRWIVAFWWDDLRPWVEALAEPGGGHRLRALVRQMRRLLDEMEGAL